MTGIGETAAARSPAPADPRGCSGGIRQVDSVPAFFQPSLRGGGLQGANVWAGLRRSARYIVRPPGPYGLGCRGLEFPNSEVGVGGDRYKSGYSGPKKPRAARCRVALNFFILNMVRRAGLEPARCYPLAPQASASANSATSAGGTLLLLLRHRGGRGHHRYLNRLGCALLAAHVGNRRDRHGPAHRGRRALLR
jgi:hypothetical protein